MGFMPALIDLAGKPDRVAPPAIGTTEKGYPPTDDAPGTYVHPRFNMR